MTETNLPQKAQKTTTTMQGFDREQIELIKTQICKDATDDELKLFVNQCQRTGLDPFSRQIYAIKRYNSNTGQKEMVVQTSVDGLRLTAERSGKYEGQTQAFYYDAETKEWTDVWLEPTPPPAAKIGVYKTGFREPLWAVAKWENYMQTKKDGTLTSMWKKMPELMLSKCAESLALRKAFPAETSGLYTKEEMAQSTPVEVKESTTPQEPINLEDTVIEIGKKFRGKKYSEVSSTDLASMLNWINEQTNPSQSLCRFRSQINQVLAKRQENPAPPQGMNNKEYLERAKAIFATVEECGWNVTEVNDYIGSEFGKTTINELTDIEYNTLYNHIRANRK